MARTSNWGIESREVLGEISKPDATSSIIRVCAIETKDNKQFVDVRNWYNKNGESGFNNMGKGIWISNDKETISKLVEVLKGLIS